MPSQSASRTCTGCSGVYLWCACRAGAGGGHHAYVRCHCASRTYTGYSGVYLCRDGAGRHCASRTCTGCSGVWCGIICCGTNRVWRHIGRLVWICARTGHSGTGAGGSGV